MASRSDVRQDVAWAGWAKGYRDDVVDCSTGRVVRIPLSVQGDSAYLASPAVPLVDILELDWSVRSAVVVAPLPVIATILGLFFLALNLESCSLLFLDRRHTHIADSSVLDATERKLGIASNAPPASTTRRARRLFASLHLLDDAAAVLAFRDDWVNVVTPRQKPLRKHIGKAATPSVINRLREASAASLEGTLPCAVFLLDCVAAGRASSPSEIDSAAQARPLLRSPSISVLSSAT